MAFLFIMEMAGFELGVFIYAFNVWALSVILQLLSVKQHYYFPNLSLMILRKTEDTEECNFISGEGLKANLTRNPSYIAASCR